MTWSGTRSKPRRRASPSTRCQKGASWRLWSAEGRDGKHEQQIAVEPAESSQIPEALYLGIDGTGVPMRRSELIGRSAKQPDGSVSRVKGGTSGACCTFRILRLLGWL